MPTQRDIVEKVKIFSKDQYNAEELKTIESEHRQAYLKLFGSTVFVQTLFPLILGFVFYPLIDSGVLFGWLSAILLVTLARSYLSFNWYAKQLEPKKTALFEQVSLALAFLAGCLWGATVFVMDFQQYPEASVFLNIIVFGLAAGSVGIGSYWLEYFLIYNFTVFGLYIFTYSFGLPEPYYLLAGSTLLFVVFMTQIALVFHRGNAQNILLNIRNEKLAVNLSKQKQEAESIAASRNRFLAAASHDLRQPVQALNFFLAVLKEELNSERGIETYKKVQKCTDGINDLLGSILDLSKLDADVVPINKEAVALKPIFSDFEQQFNVIAERKGLRFEVNACDHYVLSDETFLRRILSNLITNAISYTTKGTVTLSAGLNDKGVLIDVKDTGLGLSEVEQSKVFEEFYQIDNPERDRKKGLGLGLSIVKRLCLLINAPLTLVSEKGKGSCFSLQLVECPPATLDTAKAAPTTARTLTKDKNILIIDDNQELRESLRLLLLQWQCIVIDAATATQACQSLTLQGLKPDLIIADYRLRNNKTGVQAIETVKKLLNDNDIPAIIISGDTEPARLKEVLDSGYNLLHKPVKPAHLRMMLQQAL